MKCSDEISCQGNDNDFNFKGLFFPISFNGFVFLAELDKPNDIERSLACDFYFVCANQRALSDAKKGSWLHGLVVPYRYIR